MRRPSGPWCPKATAQIKRARLRNAAIRGATIAVISLPLAVILSSIEIGHLPGGIGAASGILGAMAPALVISLGAQWLAFLVLVRRGQRTLREMPTTRLGPPLVVDNRRLLRFKETHP